MSASFSTNKGSPIYRMMVLFEKPQSKARLLEFQFLLCQLLAVVLDKLLHLFMSQLPHL